jgi:hypothetical protein
MGVPVPEALRLDRTSPFLLSNRVLMLDQHPQSQQIENLPTTGSLKAILCGAKRWRKV